MVILKTVFVADTIRKNGNQVAPERERLQTKRGLGDNGLHDNRDNKLALKIGFSISSDIHFR
jgi:hypothetical protein